MLNTVVMVSRILFKILNYKNGRRIISLKRKWTTAKMKGKQSDEILLMNGVNPAQIDNGTFPNEVTEEEIEKGKNDQKAEKDTKDVEPGFTTMSPLQKFFFIFSLLLSVLYVVVFIWIIPCKTSLVTNTTEMVFVTEEWKLNLPNIKLSSNLELLKQLGGYEPILVFGYGKKEDESAKSGLISIHGNEGKKLWQVPLLYIPRYCKCNWFDLDSDDEPECIIVGDEGILAVVNATNGEVIWDTSRFYTSTLSEAVSIPAVIPDCDEDGISDIAAVYSTFNSTYSKSQKHPENVAIVILSGRTGKMIGSRADVPQCESSVDVLQIWKRDNTTSEILFYCIDKEGFGNIWSISTNKLCHMMSNELSQPSDFTKIIKIDIRNAEQFNILYRPTRTTEWVGENMLIAWSGGNIVLLDGETGNKYWKVVINEKSNIREILTGHFSNDKDIQIAVISNNAISKSKITVLHMSNGSKIMESDPLNYFITSAVLVPGVFGGMDGILMKHVNMVSKISTKGTSVQTGSTNLDNRIGSDEIVVQEEYLLSSCIKNKSPQSILKNQVIRLCYRDCESDIYSSIATAVVGDLDADNSQELITVAMNVSSYDKNPSKMYWRQKESTTVKLLHLQSVLFSTNSSYQSC